MAFAAVAAGPAPSALADGGQHTVTGQLVRAWPETATPQTAADLANTFSIYPSLSGSITEAGRRLMGVDELS